MIELIRDARSKAGTHGTFELGGNVWHSLEQPDLGNEPYKSCVPQGEYDLIPYFSKKYGSCYIMVNEDLNVYQFEDSPGRPTDGRFLCLFVHPGNYVHNFQGCVGAGYGYLDNSDMITDTRNACVEVNALVVEEGSYRLRISHVFE